MVAIPQTAPVPPNKDTGANYQLHPISTGPYKFQSYQLNKQLTLVPNTYWKASTDPNAKQLASKIIMTMNMNANDIDNRLLAGDLNVDAAGTGVQAAARAKILSTPSLKASSDDPIGGFTWFAAHQHHGGAAEQRALPDGHRVRGQQDQLRRRLRWPGGRRGDRQHGGAAERGRPEVVRPVRRAPKPGGDVAAAKEQLKLCGQPNGFTTGITYRSDRPKEVAAAQGLQASLATVGIKTSLHGFPTGTYDSNFAGVPKYEASTTSASRSTAGPPDWPDGYGFFYYIADGKAISPAGNTNLAQLNDPKVNSLLTKMALDQRRDRPGTPTPARSTCRS